MLATECAMLSPATLTRALTLLSYRLQPANQQMTTVKVHKEYEMHQERLVLNY
jgi:hypothetical protein